MKVFVSHAADDRYFVSLLEALLEFHRLEPRCAPHPPQDGSRVRGEELREADALIAVVGPSAARSGWITEAISVFEDHNPEGRVLPILVGGVDPASVAPRLRAYRCIDLGVCMKTGFDRLFADLGRRFLSGDPRTETGRRGKEDRRRSSVLQRMHVGFLLGYCRHTQRSPVGGLPPYVREAGDLRGILREESRRYEYRDPETDEPQDPDVVLDEGVSAAWSSPEADGRNASDLLYAIASFICTSREVRMTERRHGSRSVTEPEESEAEPASV